MFLNGVWWSSCALACYLIAKSVYNLFFHPLRHYPGPIFGRATRLYHVFWDVRGQSHWKIKEWHDTYGDVVRIAPDELSYANGQEAWPAIYGFPTKDGLGNFPKDAKWWNKNEGGVDNILTADDEGHRRMRRLQNPAFSDKALRQQEVVIERYTSLMIHKLHGEATSSVKTSVDIMSWYHFLMFDLIGDLAFGEPFYCLRDQQWHWWLRAVFDIFQAGTFIRAARRFASVVYYLVLLLVIPKRLLKTRKEQYEFGCERVDRRLQQSNDRPDFMSYILKSDDEKGMTVEEMYTTAQVLIVAGSETTATGLTAATYFLLSNPSTWQKVCAEVRNQFEEESEITIQNTAGLTYLKAVLDETLRLAPSGPGTFPRTVPAGGRMICGQWVPGGYAVGVHHLATGRSKSNFRDADSFRPERWLGDEAFSNDKRTAAQPFSFGPRNCIGKNLALTEMRTILARVVWNFDMELDPVSSGWLDRQKMFTTWHKTEMSVALKPRITQTSLKAGKT